MVVLAWATATFWFPVMIAIGIWRHIISRVPLRYHPSYWALVFPLGMYGVASARMIDATGLTALDWLPPLVLAIALTAWALAFAGLATTALRSLRDRRAHHAASGDAPGAAAKMPRSRSKTEAQVRRTQGPRGRRGRWHPGGDRHDPLHRRGGVDRATQARR
jgi:hypothetical protein